jgi:hypothetical protein
MEAPGWVGPRMWSNRVPEPKIAKNRLHVDLRARDAMRAEAHGCRIWERV